MSPARGRVVLGLCLALVTAADAVEYSGTPESYRDILPRLRPGDRLELVPGLYVGGLPLRGIHGTPAQPIVIDGPTGESPATFLARTGRNTITLTDVSHLVIRNLFLDGANQEAHAVKAERQRGALVHHIVLERLTIIRHGVDQGIVGISTQAPAAFWTIRNNVVIGAGTGMYLGDSDGSAPFVAGLIEGNAIVNTLGYNIQIKHQRSRPTLSGLPDSPQRTVIRGNFLSKAANASAGKLARPNLLLGHFPIAGPGSDDQYVVKENVFFANPAESLLQAEGNVVISRNLFVNPAGNAISIQPHHDRPRRIAVSANFIIASGYGIRLQGAHPDYTQTISGNRDYSGGANDPGTNANARAEAESAFREWLFGGVAARPGGRSGDRGITNALRVACGQLGEGRPEARPGLIPRALFVCQQL